MTRPSHCLGAAIALALLGISGAFAQTAPKSLAECAAIAVDSERLACYDRAAGRAPAPPSADRPSGEVPDQKPAPAAGALRASPSLIDAAWGFDKGSNPYIIDLYDQNYLLVARYTDKVNTAPFTPSSRPPDSRRI